VFPCRLVRPPARPNQDREALLILPCHTRHGNNLVLLPKSANGIIHLRHTPNCLSSGVTGGRRFVRIPAPGQTAKVAMLGVLDWARRELIVRTSRTKRSSDFIALLEEIDRRYGPKLGVAIQPVVLVLDNGPIHTSKATRAALAQRAHWLTVEWLPKYAPELNDIEAVWRDLKRHHLAHQTPSGPEDLDQAIHDAVRKLNTERSRHSLANRRIAA
jgi:transposase